MAKIRIELDKNACIGCGACAVECPENFEIVETDDGYKAKVKEKFVDDIGCNRAAADVCPVEAIKVVEE